MPGCKFTIGGKGLYLAGGVVNENVWVHLDTRDKKAPKALSVGLIAGCTIVVVVYQHAEYGRPCVFFGHVFNGDLNDLFTDRLRIIAAKAVPGQLRVVCLHNGNRDDEPYQVFAPALAAVLNMGVGNIEQLELSSSCHFHVPTLTLSGRVDYQFQM